MPSRLSGSVHHQLNVYALATWGALLFILLVFGNFAQAQTFTTLYNFTGGADGRWPYAGVIDYAGNLYGTTFGGGPAYGGVVFQLSSDGIETVLHGFGRGDDEGEVYAPVLRDEDGNLYGTTVVGGNYGQGTVFKLDPAGRETVLHNFAGGTTDGCDPIGGLATDACGNLFGTTTNCGINEGGILFRVSKKKVFTVLHDFSGGSSGSYPFMTTPVLAGDGTIYGITQYGGAGNVGMVYKLSKGRFTPLYNFKGGVDACYPEGTPVMDGLGNLYGVAAGCGLYSAGTVWKVTQSGSETILHNFAGGTAEGCFAAGGLVRDSRGNLYGTTAECGAAGNGTVWELRNDGTFTLLHSFTGSEGAFPMGDLLRNSDGALYGTTAVGGTYDHGTVWSYKRCFICR
jgi:uncharacterized repeat protein (TIGR03803 family)